MTLWICTWTARSSSSPAGPTGWERHSRACLVEEGARVAVCGRDPDRLAATEQRLRDAGGDALAVQADVTQPA